MKRQLVLTLTLAAALAIGGASLAAQAHPATATNGSLRHSHNLLGESIGLVGYDPVSYFPEGGGKPERGLINISQDYQGVTYRFSSEEHRGLFIKNPGKYLPAYGGWCAWAAGELGKRVDVDPESFEIRNGRLYVFYRDRNLDTRALWLKNTRDLIAKADSNWPELAR